MPVMSLQQLILTLHINKLYQLKPPISAALTHKVRPFLNQVGSDSQNLPVQSTWRSKHYLPSKTLRFLENPKLYPVSTISCESFWHILVEFWLVITYILTFELWLAKKNSSLCEGVNWRIFFFIIIYLIGSKLLIV